MVAIWCQENKIQKTKINLQQKQEITIWRCNSQSQIRKNAGEEILRLMFCVFELPQLFIEAPMQASTGKVCLLIALTLAVLLPNTAAKQFVKAASSPQVDTYRAMVYAQTDDRIKRYNQLYGEHFTSGHNQFSDLTIEEFAATYLGGGMSPPGSVSRTNVGQPTVQERKNLNTEGSNNLKVTPQAPLINAVVPTTFSIDYSVSPVLITNVKNQGGCGSCWAFAGIAEIESFYLKKHKLWLDLSEQQMVDCLPAVQPGNKGCGGGYLDSVGYYSTLNPIAQEKYYPYKAVDQTCSQANIGAGKTFKINTYVYISDCITLADTLLSYKPIGVCGPIDDKWQSYKGGVILNCGGTIIGGHCVLLVGASSDNTTNSATNYWKVRNSWGTSYGESGFMKLYRDKSVTTGGFCGFCGGAIYSQ